MKKPEGYKEPRSRPVVDPARERHRHSHREAPRHKRQPRVVGGIAEELLQEEGKDEEA